jgi:hypothetical protein
MTGLEFWGAVHRNTAVCHPMTAPAHPQLSPWLGGLALVGLTLGIEG